MAQVNLKPDPGPDNTADLEREAAEGSVASELMAAEEGGATDLISRMNEESNESAYLTGGDIEVDLQSAASVGEEAPGGENPTPGQDSVDAIGRALGLQYQDTEQLGTRAKLEKRDDHRWELDPRSSEDYPERMGNQ